MKKFILLAVSLVLPFSVYAMDNSEEFAVGDSVNVALYSKEDKPDNENGFHVLKESKAGEETVTLIYDGSIEGSPTVYDEARPDDNHEASTVFEESVVYQKLQSVVNKDSAKWNVIKADLLSLDDIQTLGIAKNSSGIYEIPAKYAFLAPAKIPGAPAELYNYWTRITDDSASNTSVYCVTYNENRTNDNDIWATLVSNNIISITNNTKCGIRPVVIVKKEYILCNNSKKPNEPTTTVNPDEPENVDTGVTDYILPLAGVLLVAGTAIVLTKKKNIFNQI